MNVSNIVKMFISLNVQMHHMKEFKTVQISLSVYNRLREELEKSKTKTTLAHLIESILLEHLETSELMREYGPFLSYVSNSEDTIYINDWKQRRIAGVRVNMREDGSFSLYCDLDNSENCVHIGFVFALPEFYKILKEKGVKPPKI